MKTDRWVKIISVIAILVFGVIFPLRSAGADTGPKPSMSFKFVYEISPIPAIVSGTQLECADAACTSPQPLAEMGPQRFSCRASDCSSMAYHYSDYHKLRVDFSDGKTRESNVFGKKYFDAVYQVTVRANDLVVKEQRGGGMPLFFFLLGNGNGFICIAAPFLLIFLVVLIIVSVRAAEFNQARGTYITAWVFSLLPLALNFINPGVFSGLIFTLVVEMAIALAYGLWRKRPLVLLLSVVWMMNLLTYTLFTLLFGGWGILQFFGNLGFLRRGWVSILIGEGFVWLVEAGILAWALRKQIKFREALALSAVLNLASFGLGLLLPF
jgi:hypothetical protein